MASSGLSLNNFLAFLCALTCAHTVTTQDVCTKFDVGGPCNLLPSYGPQELTTSSSFAMEENPFCDLVCSMDNAHYFRDYCPCAGGLNISKTTSFSFTTTTTTMSTTTQRPATCYYSTQRPARLSSVSRRLYSSVPAVPECEFPGVVGLFYEYNGATKLACMASLLDTDKLLINERLCKNYVERMTLYVLVGTYKTAALTKNVSVNRNTLQKLDPTGKLGGLYTVQLTTNLTFDRGCIQPICPPNANIPATDIDLEDCRVVGYGSRDDSFTAATLSELMEIKVVVNPLSVNYVNLTVTRVDKNQGNVCMGDDSAPLICSHKYTREHVTVGVTSRVANPCSSGAQQSATFANFFHESKNKAYYNGIQQLKYANPDIFTALE